MARMASVLWVLLLMVSVASAQDFVSVPLSPVPPEAHLQSVSRRTADPEVANNFTPPAPGSDFGLPSAPPAGSMEPIEPVQPATVPEVVVPYRPLSVREKLHIVLRRSYSANTLASAVVDTTIAQAEGQWFQYGGGMQGWGQRFGAILASTESRRFIQGFVLSAALHQDPRYFPSMQTGFVSRVLYAASRTLITRSDTGFATFNSSEVLGAFLTCSLQNAYFPRPDRGWDNTLGRFTGSLISDTTSNVIREFRPDLRRLFHKHEPQSLKDFESHIPKPIQQLAGQ